MPDYSRVDYTRDRRPEGKLTPTHMSDLYTFLINPLREAGIKIADKHKGEDKFKRILRRVRNDIFNFEYTNGADKDVYDTAQELIYIPDDIVDAPNDIYEEYENISKRAAVIIHKGVDDYVKMLRTRDKKAHLRDIRSVEEALRESTPLVNDVIRKIADYAVPRKLKGGSSQKRQAKYTMRRLKLKKSLESTRRMRK